MTQTELIEAGIGMFNQSCHDVTTSIDKNGQRWWHGKTCEGGGAYITHTMNQDLMTPTAVAFECDHHGAKESIRQLREKFKEDCDLAAMKAYGVAP